MAGTGPTFIYIGTPKAGSSWLFEAFKEHPEIFVHPAKSSGRYECEEPGDLSDYMASFECPNAFAAAGEIAHDAYITPGAAERLHEEFPDIKILVCLREPGEFAGSCIRWWQTHTDRFGQTIDEMIAHPHFRALIGYEKALRLFFKLFPRDQIHVIFFESIAASGESVLAEVFDFLGADSSFRPYSTDVTVNKSRPARYAPLTRAAYRMGDVARRLGLSSVVERVKRSNITERLLYPKVSSGDIDPELDSAIAKMRDEIRPRLDGIEALIGKPLPPSWRED